MRTHRSARRSRTARVGASLLLCAGLLAVAGCGTNSAAAPSRSGETPDREPFPAVAAFDYQLGGAYDPAPGVQLVVRDREAPPAAGLYNVCYINAFQSQPGEQHEWAEDLLLSVGEEPAVDPDWPDEILLDTSTSGKRDAILDIVGPWIEACARDGFDAVEFDNLDSFTRSRDVLTLDDNIALARALADVAHQAGLAAGQKNAAEYARRLADETGFDFAISEGCAAFDECAAYTEAYGAAVIDIEYTDDEPRDFAEMCADPDSPASMILRDRDLVTPDDGSYVFRTCAD